MTAPNHHHLHQIFYKDVRIPLTNVVGGVNNGWAVATATFGFECQYASMAEQFRYGVLLEKLIELARRKLGNKALEHDEIGARLAHLRAEHAGVRAMIYMMVSRAERGAPAAEAALVRAFFSQLQQRTHRVALDIIGSNALEAREGDPWVRTYLRSLSTSAATGVPEI